MLEWQGVECDGEGKHGGSEAVRWFYMAILRTFFIMVRWISLMHACNFLP